MKNKTNTKPYKPLANTKPIKSYPSKLFINPHEISQREKIRRKRRE